MCIFSSKGRSFNPNTILPFGNPEKSFLSPGIIPRIGNKPIFDSILFPISHNFDPMISKISIKIIISMVINPRLISQHVFKHVHWGLYRTPVIELFHDILFPSYLIKVIIFMLVCIITDRICGTETFLLAWGTFDIVALAKFLAALSRVTRVMFTRGSYITFTVFVAPIRIPCTQAYVTHKHPGFFGIPPITPVPAVPTTR